ncbi:hypothetical protein NL676_019617 [Syzygium grande]|nr:hypothetical protein NL676_019617 [Syzygium grande]
MENAEKVKLVQCPKCENLLLELADCTVYECGGCRAVLNLQSGDRAAVFVKAAVLAKMEVFEVTVDQRSLRKWRSSSGGTCENGSLRGCGRAKTKESDPKRKQRRLSYSWKDEGQTLPPPKRKALEGRRRNSPSLLGGAFKCFAAKSCYKHSWTTVRFSDVFISL